ncbi:hypothetical protein [Thiothrix unzii]|jgi:hypothetical protein|uniref:Uncharacterized protein n=1 Tax=Thiothrix unzii TaxID=111769 RepID=A0A975IJ75_9GAMM|nr:hypothetical protein [Thiothrix unzii]QTR54620.1 hypothetical protein J9260_05900 [Thiothrix unzii]
MARKNALPTWYPAECHRDNWQWQVSQWIDALSYRSQLVIMQAQGLLTEEHLEAVIHGCSPKVQPRTVSIPVEIDQPDNLLFKQFSEALAEARQQSDSSLATNICQRISTPPSKFKLLNLMDSLGKLHQLRVLDWIDLALWSRLTGVTFEATYLGDIFWCDEDIDRRYRLVTRTRPLACQLIAKSVIYRLLQVNR